MAASAGNASEPYPSNSPFIPPGELPAGRPAATTLRRRLTKSCLLSRRPLPDSSVRAPALAPQSRLTPTFCFFYGGRDANDFGSENTSAGDCAARAERQARSGARRQIYVALVYARLSLGS